MKRFFLFFLFISSFGLSSFATAQSYTVTDLGGGSYPTAINATGEVVGFYEEHVGPLAFSWTASGGFTTLPPLFGSTISRAYGASSTGLVVGESVRANAQAVIWLDGAIEELGTLGGRYSGASGVSSDGKVTGIAEDSAQYSRAFLWTKSGGMIDVGTLGGLTSYGLGVNRLGQVAGFADLACVCPYHAFVWSAETGMVDLGKSGSGISQAQAINDLGQIAGYVENGSAYQAVFWDSNGDVEVLDALSTNSGAFAINNLGQVVGENNYPSTRTPQYYAFIWTQQTGMQNLNDLIPSGSGWVLDAASGINDSGQIVGQGTLNGALHSFLLTPTTSASESAAGENSPIK